MEGKGGEEGREWRGSGEGVERSGEEWRGVERGGVERGGVEREVEKRGDRMERESGGRERSE